MNFPADPQLQGKPTRVIVVDSQQFFILGIGSYLQACPNIKLVGYSTNADDALQLTNELHPDVVLTDINLQGKSGIELAAQLRCTAPWLNTIAYATHADDHQFTDAIDAGVKGYLLKTDPPEILLKAIETVIKGEQYLTDTLGGRLLRLMQRTETNPIKQPRKIIHTEFELAVIRAICKALKPKEIAGRLNVEERQVTSTKEKLFKQLNINTSVELAMYAVKNYIYNPWE